ncbi:MAG TPA: hypothetical protein VFO66_12335 [Gemmatimonadaceae bacterium]|nr:hypothetical protein [Gemmatimonadaceae bacterium]
MIAIRLRALALLLIAIPVGAQAPETEPLGRAAYQALVRVEQEPSYATVPFLMFGLPEHESRNGPLKLLYEASLAPAFFLFAGKKPWLLAVTPKIVLRQFYDASEPVPPPSYMPRVTLYYWGAPFAQRRHIDSVVYSFMRVGHHSNGQEEPFYDSTGAVNVKNGDFYANFLELGVSKRFFGRGPTIGTQDLSFEWYPAGFMAKAARPIYGRYRAKAGTRLQWPGSALGEIDGANLQVQYLGGSLAPERRSLQSRLTLSATVYSDLKHLGDFSPFVGYYTGQDYYNIRFGRQISVLRIGMMTGR